MSIARHIERLNYFISLTHPPTHPPAHPLTHRLNDTQLELRYGMPQLQIPVELVILHLAMLAFLEKYQVRLQFFSR